MFLNIIGKLSEQLISRKNILTHKYNDIAYENISDTFYLVNFCLLASFLLLLFENFILNIKLYLIKSWLNEILIQLIP